MTAFGSVAGPTTSLPPRRYNPLTVWAVATYGTLLVLAAAAWWISDIRMSGMDAGPGSPLGTFAFFVTTWVVMMTAMMFPSVAPMVHMYVNIQRGRRRRGMAAATGATAAFVVGYLVIWTLAGVLAYGAVKIGAWLGGDSITWTHHGRWIAGAVIFAAAAYELTPLKQACLSHCRGPVSFILSSWRSGRRGALLMGMKHGAWCLGCCWALMAALFALGVMSLPWMLVIGALIAIEKLLPWRRVGVAVTTTVLVLLAAGVAFAPKHVPGLTVPKPGGGMSMMS